MAQKAAAVPEAKDGILDLRNIDLNTNRQPLNGQWYTFDSQLLVPEDIVANGRGFSKLPNTWNELRSSGEGSGYATYALYVLVSPGVKSLALEIPQVYSSYTLWINHDILATNGKPGESEETSVPQWMPQTITFDNPRDTLKIVLQIANFHHFKGGIKDPIYIGSSELLQGNRSLAVGSNLLESILLALLGFAFLVVYLLMKKKKATMYFALLCLTWALRVGFSNLYIFISYMPDFDWNIMIRIEYLTLFLTMIWAILFLGRVFLKETNKFIKYTLVGANIIFSIYTLFVPAKIFTSWLTVYLSFCGILLVYAIIIILRAWINQRAGSTYLTVSFLLGIFIFTYDVFAYEGLFSYNPVIFSIGYVTIFSLMGVVLLLYLDIIKSKKSLSVLTYKDLYGTED